MIVSRFDGSFPRDRETLRRLPGIGAYTSGAICAFAFHQPVAFIDTNIRRVFIHFFFQDVDNVRDSQLIPLVEETVFRPDPRTWYYAVMDYGAMPALSFPNANRRSAHYVRQSPFENSNRQIRGRILKILAETPRSRSDLIDALDFDDERISGSLDDLAAEGLIVSESDVVSLPGDIEPQQD
jgi:A/G-specific adenine glycosylase